MSRDLSSPWRREWCTNGKSLTVLVLLSSLHSSVLAQVPRYTLPSPISVREGETATLECGSRNTSDVVSWLVQKNAGGSQTSLMTGQGGMVLGSYDKTRISYEGHLNVIIKNVSRQDDAIYRCQVGVMADYANARLTVLVPPKSVEISRQPRENLQQDDRVSLECSSLEGNPPPQVEWRVNGVVMTDSVQQMPAPTKFGKSSSRLTLKLTPAHDRATISCTVVNEANSHAPIVMQQTLSVRYKPVVTLLPSSNLAVRAGAETRVTCQVRANPPATIISWMVLSGDSGANHKVVSRQATYNFKVTENMERQLMCNATNSVGWTTEVLVFDVQTPPVIEVPPTQTILEGETRRLLCKVTANPKPRKLQWLKDGVAIPLDATPPAITYTIEEATAADAGQYECVAENVLTAGGVERIERSSARVEVNVQYRAGKPVITPGKDALTANVGSTVELVCSLPLPGVPPSHVQWTYNGMPVSDETSLVIRNVNLANSGVYACAGKHEKLGAGPAAVIDIQVLQKPNLLLALPAARDTTLNHDAPDLVLSCTVEASPVAVITWTHNGVAVDDAVRIQTSREGFEVTSQLTLMRPFVRKNSGVYECEGRNSQGSVKTSRIVKVNYLPEVTPGRAKQALREGSPASLLCRVASETPAGLKMVWRRGEEVLNPQPHMQTRQPVEQDVTDFTLILSPGVLGDYTCEATNQFGVSTATQSILAPGAPDTPDQVKLIPVDPATLSIHWEIPYNGGEPACTLLDIYSASGTLIKSFNVTAGSTNVNISDLIGSTEYSVTLRAASILGTSEATKKLTVVMPNSTLTQSPLRESPLGDSLIYGVLTACVVLLALMIILLLAICWSRSRRTKDKSRSPPPALQSDASQNPSYLLLAGQSPPAIAQPGDCYNDGECIELPSHSTDSAIFQDSYHAGASLTYASRHQYRSTYLQDTNAFYAPPTLSHIPQLRQPQQHYDSDKTSGHESGSLTPEDAPPPQTNTGRRLRYEVVV